MRKQFILNKDELSPTFTQTTDSTSLSYPEYIESILKELNTKVLEKKSHENFITKSDGFIRTENC